MSGKKCAAVPLVVPDTAKTVKETSDKIYKEIDVLVDQIEKEGDGVALEKQELENKKNIVSNIHNNLYRVEQELRRSNVYDNGKFQQVSQLQNQFEGYKRELLALQSNLQAKRNAILKAKAEKEKAARQKLSEVENIIGRWKYSDPGNPKQTISACDYCMKILEDGSLYKEVENGIQKSKSLIRHGKFEDVIKVLEGTEQSIESLREVISKRDIEIRKTITTGLSFQKVFKELGYSEMKTFFENGKVKNGIVVEVHAPQRVKAHIKSNNDYGLEIDMDTPEDDGCISIMDELRDSLRLYGIEFHQKSPKPHIQQKAQVKQQEKRRNSER